MSAPKRAAAKVASKLASKVASKAAPKVAAKPARRVKAVPLPGTPGAASPATAQAAPAATSEAATWLAREIDHALSEGRADVLSDEALQALMAAVCRSYAARIEAGGNFPALAGRSLVSSTDVMVTASGLLKAANLAVFELGMWQSWTGR
jgi:hypothetical protein